MKRLIITPISIGFLLLVLNCHYLKAQENVIAKEMWAELATKKYMADFFNGFFINLGVEILETGEKLTVFHEGDHFKIVEGIALDQVDYVLPIRTQNVKNLVQHAADDVIDEEETFKILAVMFTPMTSMTLTNELMTQNIPRFFSNIENNIHVTLYNENRTDSAYHTLLFINKEWIVVSGYHGTPKRKFELSVEQGLTYQKHVFEAIKSNHKKDWRAFKKWYLNWRKDVSVPVKS